MEPPAPHSSSVERGSDFHCVCHEEEAGTGQGTQSVEVCSPLMIPLQQAPRLVFLKAEDTIFRPPGRDPRQQVISPKTGHKSVLVPHAVLETAPPPPTGSPFPLRLNLSWVLSIGGWVPTSPDPPLVRLNPAEPLPVGEASLRRPGPLTILSLPSPGQD